tara:strand:- start:16729 stop:16917 length:189 start_codon:yes stop_codon:yes gene_type:complete
MKVKPFTKKIIKFSAVGMPCTSKELNDLKDGKEIALPKETAELMQQMGLVQIIENKKKKKEK